MTRFQKLATGALVSVLVLMFVGAIVRVTGAGMGCPDWPTCWGCLIPPTKVEDVDFSKLPIERFKKKAANMGRDPDSISVESLRQEFNPRHVWTEFINRMSSMPVGFFSLATFIAAFWQRQKRPLVFWMAFTSLAVVLINAWMGARVVYSGLAPGVLTAHLALAMSLLGTLCYCAWRGTDDPWRIGMNTDALGKSRIAVTVLLAVILTEGILGSQIREMTDELAKSHSNAPRSSWIAELEHSWVYLFHRSFSWVVLVATLWAWALAKRHRVGGAGKVERTVLGIVIAQMVLGLVMAQVHIYSWVQVLHVGLSAILLTFVWLWRFGLSAGHHRIP
ncbi:COX15/CtaA family protein [Luteolibacter yonseiensis]|uniref:COX15/CtaA family protein n=1 Tax=Luteolibacter yonseiensis TaxID=1144680 RepID=A0A934R8T0_9BACT|nr:COX15/CtaA family protein [Luteolibacter yonseiensis]MBK1817315.1 COX15/CtaA family protein [Luteolibacter yonseiensis]